MPVHAGMMNSAVIGAADVLPCTEVDDAEDDQQRAGDQGADDQTAAGQPGERLRAL